LAARAADWYGGTSSGYGVLAQSFCPDGMALWIGPLVCAQPQSKFLMYWDVVTAVAMLWTAFVTPFEVGFLAAAEDVTSPLFIVNRLIDTVFIVDMALAFFVPYRASQSHGGMLVRPAHLPPSHRAACPHPPDWNASLPTGLRQPQDRQALPQCVAGSRSSTSGLPCRCLL
jgi:hypothetical protein